MEVRGRTLLRGTFDAVAEEYDRVRPRYPEAVFDDLMGRAGLRRGARVLEIGPGTGQATVALARRGLAVVAVEMGAELAASTRRHAAGFSGVEVVNARFEDWEPEVAGFDAVTSFAALHWIDPEVRYAKPARLLRPGGAIAVFDWQDALSDDGDGFFRAVLEDYEAVVPECERTLPVPPAPVPDRASPEIDASGVFAPATSRRYHWSGTYGPDARSSWERWRWPASSPGGPSPSSPGTVVRPRPRGRPTWPSTWPATTLRRVGPGPGLAPADLVGPKSPWATTLGGCRASATAAPRSPNSKTTRPPRCRGGASSVDPQSPGSSARRAYSAPPAAP